MPSRQNGVVYVPPPFRMTDVEARAAIDAAGVGVLVTSDPAGGFDTCLLPWLLDGDRLLGHVARANPIWRNGGTALVTFVPAHGYVSPSWYPSNAEHGRVVPTWNYEMVVVHGELRSIDDPAVVHEVVSRLTEVHESRVGSTWKVTDAPDDFVDQQLRAVVGVEVGIRRIEGKAKLSQNRPSADAAGVAAATHDLPLGDAMRRAIDHRSDA